MSVSLARSREPRSRVRPDQRAAQALASRRTRARSSPSSARTGRARRRRSGHLRHREGARREDRLRRQRRSPACPAHNIVQLGLAQSPEGRKIFPRLTVLENLEMGAFTRSDSDGVQSGHREGVRDVPDSARAADAGRRLALRRRTADARHRPRADGSPETAACSTSLRLAWLRRSSCRFST